MELSEALKLRRSIRKYKPNTNITDEQIKAILEAAMMAPSACNTRPWEFIVIKSDEAKKKALDLHPYARHLTNASAGVLVCARPDLQEGIANGYFPQDCGAAIENMLLKALDLGFGACWCGIYPREERVKAFTDAFETVGMPFALVVIGEADEEPPTKGFYDENKVKFL